MGIFEIYSRLKGHSLGFSVINFSKVMILRSVSSFLSFTLTYPIRLVMSSFLLYSTSKFRTVHLHLLSLIVFSRDEREIKDPINPSLLFSFISYFDIKILMHL